ncbi:hypothetical protein [Embleya sp. NPDC020630]|uniref:hypothetical protein n=1 Tax=Embleya sp. NPDC020630 TaxID=3363979 RepID=UPI00378F60CD
MTTEDIAERFKRETAEHEMTVLHDEGLYRHLRFAKPAPEGSMFWWELVTWPGCLAVRGDMGGEWIFTRLPDMFRFFRSDGGEINPWYWSQKTELGRSACEVYDEAVFRQVVTEHFVDAVRYGDAPRGLGKALRAEVLDQDLSNEDEARALLEEFEFGAMFKATCLCGESSEFAKGSDAHLWRHRHIRAGNATRTHVSSVERVEGFRFSDVWEWSFRDYDPSFIWACHAIVRGIQMYDLHRAIPAPAAVAAESGGAA